jgi:NADPH-dependent ferric siderophore reductase
MAEHDVEVTIDGGVAKARLQDAEAVMRPTTEELVLEAHAPSQAQLEDVAAFLAAHVLEFAHPEAPDIRWSGFAERKAFSDFREMSVVRVLDLTPHMRRITLTGQDLDRFATDDNLHVRLFFPPDGHAPEWPTRGVNGLSQAIDPARRPQVRKYTIRRIDLGAGEVDIDFVLHADAGPGSDWAGRARPHDVIGMAGPGGRGIRAADWHLLVGDETALPAIARALEGLPATASGVAIVEIPDEADRLALSKPEGIQLRWLHRTNGSPSLDEVVREISIPKDRAHFCWAGAEFDAIQKIRRYWRDECGVAKADQLAVAYWRRGAEGD